MLLPHFFLLQFGQWFLSLPLLSTLINSAAPVSLYSGERVERGVLKKSLKCMSSIIFTLSCPECREMMLGLCIRTSLHRPGVRGPGWGCLSEPPGSACRLHLVVTLRAWPCWVSGRLWVPSGVPDTIDCRMQGSGCSVHFILFSGSGAYEDETRLTREFWFLLFLLVCFLWVGNIT